MPPSAAIAHDRGKAHFLKEAIAGRENHGGQQRKRNDESMSNGSNLDHFMCEICAREFGSATVSLISARVDFGMREVCAPSAAFAGKGRGGGRSGFTENAPVVRAASQLPPLQLSPTSKRGERAARGGCQRSPHERSDMRTFGCRITLGRRPRMSLRSSGLQSPQPSPARAGEGEGRAVEENCAAGSRGGECAERLRRHGERGEQRLR